MKAGWEVSTLGQSTNFQRGLTYSKSDEVEFSATAVLRANNIDLANAKLDLADIRYISDSVSVPESKLVKAGSLIICTASGSKSHLGKVAYIDRDYGYAFGGFMAQITASERLHPKFLYYALTGQAFTDWLGRLSSGININNLKFSDIEHFSLPLPPLEEQQRIVAVLDKAFAGIATATANAQKNLTNARALFNRYRNAILATSEEEWTSRSLGSVCDFLNGFAFKSTDTITQSNVQLIRMGNLYQNNLDLDRKPTYYPEAFSDTYSRYKLATGELIISLTGTVDKEDYGFVVEIPFSEKALLLNQRIAKLTNIDRSKTTKGYLLHLLRSRVFLDKLYASSRGTRQANLSTVTIKTMQLHFPPIEMQDKLVATFDLLGGHAKVLALNYQRKLTALAELKQSLLQKAFAGELT